jgi:hypothetical protein
MTSRVLQDISQSGETILGSSAPLKTDLSVGLLVGLIPPSGCSLLAQFLKRSILAYYEDWIFGGSCGASPGDHRILWWLAR